MSQFPYRPEPQQPAWINADTATLLERERAFFRTVYTWMFGGLALTALASLFVVNSPSLQALVIANPIVMIVLMVAEVALVFYASARLMKLSPGATAAIFIVYSLLTGLTLSVIFFAYRMPSIVMAFATASAMFGGMSLYGRLTKRDISGWGSFLIMGVIGLIVASLINLFLKSGPLDMAIATIGVLLFSGLTAYKTQMLKQFAYAAGPQGQTLAIYGALSLYITFINLFLSLLRLFGNRR
jgi:FtsH-binding integral membrane protein